MDLKFAVVGPGAVGSVLIHSLQTAGMTVAAVFDRSDKLAIPDEVGVVAVCTPDDVISDVASALATVRPDWSGRIVFHVSGALAADVLSPLSAAGAETASFHPLSSYPPNGPLRDLKDTTITVEGDPGVLETLEDLARRLGAKPIRLTVDQKGAYHLAASMASNFLATLAGAVQDVLDAAGLDRHLMDGLVADTIHNLKSTDAKTALTGPLARGDVKTVKQHIETLEEIAPEWLPLYRQAALSTIEMAFAAERISRDERQALVRVVWKDPN